MATFTLMLLVPLALIAHADQLGIRVPGPSWFDIAHADNRAARRKRR